MLGPSFQIGRSALAAYQAALSVAGQNIANVGNPDYTRQTGRLAALAAGPSIGGIRPGAGVTLASLRRNVDEALESRLRLAAAQRSGAEQVSQSLRQTEALYNELSDQDISSQLSELFGAFGSLQTQPGDSTQRDLILGSADGLVRSFTRIRSGLVQQVRELNDQATVVANHANSIIGEVARLNQQVVVAEADGVTVASALRDRRDSLIRDLGEIMDITTREQPGGAVNVYINSQPLVDFNRSRGIAVDRVLEDGLEIASVRFADDRTPITVREGKLAGLLTSRDNYIRDQLTRLDTLAGGLIYEVNKIHSSGAGLVGYTSLTSERAVLSTSAVLNTTDAGLPFPVRNGTFFVKVRDVESGAVTTRQIDIDLDGLNGNDTTLESLRAQLDAVPGVAATIGADNRLSLAADNGSDISFADDNSGVLAALGLATFFKGTNAATIGIADAVDADPRLIAASVSGAANDGENAGRMAQLAASDVTSALLGNRSIANYHSDMVGDLAVIGGAALDGYEAADAVYQGLYAQRESISGVSLDEEAINMTKYERAYQGAARYITVLNEMTDEVLRLL
ncbi:MAG: flagellar hook-associated protein FlgK [Phycisphaerales bacterium]|nr:flagellar hook-associated protein FlgK [Phycisphaerales bacterium]